MSPLEIAVAYFVIGLVFTLFLSGMALAVGRRATKHLYFGSFMLIWVAWPIMLILFCGTMFARLLK